MESSAGSENRSQSAAGVQLLNDGRYAVTGVLGEGSQGQTLEAVDKRDGRLVAIKRFSIKGANSWKDVELAEREARVLAQLRHPALPTYIEHFEEAGALYLVMERVQGHTLATLSREGGLDQHRVVRLLNDLAQVLSYLSQRSPPLIHRDIKPSNVILRPDGSFALVDFGSVRDCLKPEGGSTVVGTFGYMAPEQFQGRALPVSDIYGLGATALSVLCGVEPDQLPHQGLAIDVERSLKGQVDVRLIRVLRAMLSPDPDVRASNLGGLLKAERLWLADASTEDVRRDSPAATASPAAERARGRSQEHKRWHAGGRRDWHQGYHSMPGARYQHPEHWVFKNAFVIPLILLGLEIAKFATWALFSVALPVLFGLISIFFGRPLRRAAVRIDHVGFRGREAMTLLGQRLAEQADVAAAERHERRQRRRVRVSSRSRVADEPAAESDWREEPPKKSKRVT